jgi:hypothetical protein
MKCAFLSFQPFLDPHDYGQACASAAMLDAVSPLAEVELVYLTPSKDLIQTSRLLRERFPAVSAVKVVQYQRRVPWRRTLAHGTRLLPTTLATLDTERIRNAVFQLHSDPSIDVVHYDLMTWLYVHPDPTVPTAPTVCSGHGASSLACRRSAELAGNPFHRTRERVRALAFERFERRYLPKADIVHVASLEDARYLQGMGIDGVFRAVSMPLGDHWFVRPGDGRPLGRRVLTSGEHAHPLYREGLLRFLSAVWPPQASRFPDVELTVHSAHPVHETEAAAFASPRTTLLGAAADFARLFAEHGIFVHPLLGSTGQRNRLAIALAQGVCCLATDAAVSGMGLTPFDHYLPLKDLSAADAMRLGDVLESGELAARVGANGREKMMSEVGTKAVGTRLMDLYRETIEIGRRRTARE